MVEAALKRGGVVLFAPLAAGLLIILLVVLVVSGHAPEFRGLVHFDPDGLVAPEPSAIAQVEIRAKQESLAFRRIQGGWAVDGAAETAPAELAAHIDAALRFLHVSKPMRDIAAGELGPASYAEFGLDPPASVVTLGTADRTIADRTIATVNFGILNPAGTSQYVRLAGAATVYLMARHVGAEWQIAADMARRLAEPAVASRGASLLLPVSMGQVWAVEIVFAGKLTRFERDSAGNWFRHTGQHSHAASANAHVADPAQARLIDAALEAFDETAVETRIAHGVDEQKLAQFGLTLPHLIVLLYARDSSTPLARLELGGSADSFDRYARLAPNGDVVTVAEFEVRRLTELLKAVGAGS
jgi:hypothetical protein